MSRLPQLTQQGFLASTTSGGNGSGIVSIAVFLLIGLLTILGIVFISQAQRRVPVRHPTKRAVGHGILAGSSQTSYLPMQVNSTEMFPLIFAQSFLIFPALLSQYLVGNQITWLSSAALWVGTYLANTSLWYHWFTYFALVVLFTYFYASVLWQQQNIPENLQKHGSFIPEKRGFGMSKTREEALASIQKRLVCLQDSIKWKTEPLDYHTRQSQEIGTMRTLLAITYEFLPDEIAYRFKRSLI